MAPQWSLTEDRAFLLALVQAMAPAGPSKHQFEAAVKATNDRWTVSAVSQHYNKKLRVLTPLDTLDDANTTNPSTPVRSVAKRKTPTPGTSARGGKTPTPSASARDGKKKAPATPRFPSLKTEKAGEEESEEEAPKAKKLKVAKGKGESDGEGEGEGGGDE